MKGELAEVQEYIQTAEQIMSRKDLIAGNNALMYKILDFLANQ